MGGVCQCQITAEQRECEKSLVPIVTSDWVMLKEKLWATIEFINHQICPVNLGNLSFLNILPVLEERVSEIQKDGFRVLKH